MGLFDGLISGGFLGFWCVFVGTVLLDSMIPRYIDTMFFMGLKIAELANILSGSLVLLKGGLLVPLRVKN